jgi:hypothetical protein
MDTFATIINSIPGLVATAILTATFTGIVIFFLQQRTDNMSDFHSYLVENKMFIPEKLETEIEEIFSESIDGWVDAITKFGKPEEHTSLMNSDSINLSMVAFVRH